MAPSSSTAVPSANGKKKRKVTRESTFKKAKAAKVKERAPRTPTQSKAKGKAKAKAIPIDLRFRYRSFNERLANVHIDVSRKPVRALTGLSAPSASTSAITSVQDGSLDDTFTESLNETSFGTALSTWRELNLSVPFVALAGRAARMAGSLPQLLHHRDELTTILCQTLEDPQAFYAWEPVLDLVPRLAADLSSSFLPVYPALLRAVLRRTSTTATLCGGDDQIAAAIVEQAFACAAWCFKALAPLIVRGGDEDGDRDEDFEVGEGEGRKRKRKLGKEAQQDEEDYLLATWEMIRLYVGWVPAGQTQAARHAEVDRAAVGEMEDALEAEVTNELDKAESAASDDEDAPEPSSRGSARTAKIPPHVRRFAAEAFAFLVRKARGAQLARISTAMLSDVAALTSTGSRSLQIGEGVAGVVTEAVKSVDHRVHSRAPVLLAAFLNAAPHSENATVSLSDFAFARERTVRRVLTALVHHTQTSHFAPVLELVANLVRERADTLEQQKDRQAAVEDVREALREAVEWLAACVGTRKGTRVSDESKSPLFALLVRLAGILASQCSDAPCGQALTTLLALALPIGRIQDLIGPGMRIVEALAPPPRSPAAPSPTFSALITALASTELGWSGFRQFVLPTVLRCTSDSTALAAEPESVKAAPVVQGALSLLAVLAEAGQLDHLLTAVPTPQTTRWANNVSSALEKRLEHLSGALAGNYGASSQEQDAAPLLPTLQLLPLFPQHFRRFAPHLERIVVALFEQGLASPETARSTYLASPLNAAALLGAALTALADMIARSAKKETAIMTVVRTLFSRNALVLRTVEACSWHRTALPALAKLLETTRRQLNAADVPSPATLAPLLQQTIMSSDATLRLAALQLLSLSEDLSEMSSSTDKSRLMQRCLEVEQTPLTVERVRDRNVRLRAVARELLRMRASDTEEAPNDEVHQRAFRQDVVIRYIIGSLKLNFKPVWVESIKALEDLAARFPDEVWERSFAELSTGPEAAQSRTLPEAWSSSREAAMQEDVDEIDEDPGAQETQEDAEEEDEGEDKQFRDPQLAARRRLIVLHLNTAEGGKGVQFVVDENVTEAQRPQGRLDTLNYHAQILKFYAEVHSLAEKHNAPLVAHFFDNVHSSSASQDEEDDDVDNLSNTNKLSFAERRQRLCAYLDLFSKFSNPKALFRSAELHATFMELLAVGEPRVQRPALECLLCWKPPSIMPYAEYLRSLLDAAKFRDALVNFELSLEADVIQPAHRAELIPLVIRLLFGQMVSRRGRGTAGAGQAARKSAILAALAGCKTEELETLVELMLSTFQDVRPHFEEGDQRFVLHESAPQASTRRQAGFLSLLGEVLKHFGLALVPYWSSLLGVTLNFTHYANQLALSTPGPAGTPQRAIRQAGLKRIADFFRRPTDFDFSPYLPALFSSLISPRLPTLRTESVQSPSALLELFHVWSGRSDTIVNLAQGDNQLLVHLYACLATPSVKPVVISRILDIVERALAFAEDGSDEEGAVVRDTVVKPYVSALLASLTPLVQRSSGAAGNAIGRDELLKREISILASLAPYVTEASDATQLLSLLSPMMRKSNQLVNERTKTDLLQIFRDLLLLTPEFQDPNADIFVKRYELFSGLFATLRSRAARTTLVAAFSQFANVDPTLSRVAGLVQELNAFSAKRLDEPDFDRRLAAFDELNERGEVRLSAREWLPLLHNMLHFIQDSEELAIRSNAGTGLRQFLSVVAAAPEDGHLRGVFTKVVYVGLRKGVKSRSEQVRREVLTVLAAAVQQLGELPALEEMRGLLAGGDDEASFFNNIHHIQIHRRARALRRLGDQAEQGTLRSKIIADVFAPLVGHFLQTGSVELVDHNLVNEAIACLGRLAGQMQWSAYNALLWKYLRLANEKTAAEKVYVRTAMAILDHFHFAMDDNVELRPEQPEEDVAEAETAAEAAEVTEEEAAELEAIAKAQAQSAKIVDAVTGRLLPALMGYLEQKDETDDAVRLPIAVGVVRVVQCLPANVKQTHIAKLLSTLSNVLKSKAQETRDLARETMSKICVSLGPSYFARVVKEMRRALLRGPQLHVLAFTVHALLVHMMAAPEPLTALDQGVEDVVHVATEDIFGQTGEDRDAVEYKSKMREVRSSKSMDTFEQLAKIVVPHRMSTILLPLRDIMQQTETLKAMKAVEDVLRRVASGVNANVHFDPPAFLILCHTLVSRNAAFLQPAKLVKGNNGKGDKSLAGYKFAVQMKRQDAEKPGNKDHYARNAHRFVAFGLDLLVTAFRRGRFDFGKPDIISRIEPLVPIIGNTLYSSEVGVLNLGLKASAAILKIPLASLDATLPVFIKRIFSIVHQAGNAQSDIVQTALKTLSTILRERKAAEIKEKQLTELLGLILPDLEEPASQGTLFGLLRAIIARRFVVPEVYDVMDKVAEMLVTNQSAQVRELCRAVFLQFLLDYPQGKARLDNQLSFLAKNLSYVYESGRLSTMELLAAVFAKFSDDVLRKYTDMFFVALVMVLANDESAKCRESAAALLKTLIGLSDSEQLEKSMQMAHAWAGQRERTQLARVGIQVYGIFLEGSPETASTWMPRALSVVSDTLEASADELESIEQSAFSIFDADEDDNVDWQLTYQALQTLAKLYRTDPAPLAPRTARATWTAVRRLLLYPHKWVRTSACRLLGSLFAAVPAARPPSDAGADHPLSLEALVDTAKKLSLQLRSAVVDETLSLQIVKNLLYIGKSFALVRVDKTSTAAEVEVDGPEEESDSEDEEEGQAQEAERDDSSGVYENPLAWIFSKLSHQARSAHLARPNAGLQNQWSIQPASIFRWFAAMASQLEVARLEGFLPHIITPLHRVTDDSTIKDPQMDELKTLATEVQDLVQERVGSSKFAAVFTTVRQKTLEKRRERKTARLMETIQNPEAAARRKQQRNNVKHASRKRKSNSFAETKLRTKPLKRHRKDA